MGALGLLHSELYLADIDDPNCWAQVSLEFCAGSRMTTSSWFVWDFLGFRTEGPASKETPQSWANGGS